MIRHIVLTKFKAHVTEEQVTDIYTALAALTQELAGANNFCGGRSQSPEQIERGYMHGFVIDFDNWGALKNYSINPMHKSLGGRIVENAVGGIDGVLVLDIEV